MRIIALVLATCLSTSALGADTKFCQVPCKPKVAKKHKKTEVNLVADKCCQAPVVNVYVEQQQQQKQSGEAVAYTAEDAFFGIGVRGAVGFWSCAPNVFGLLGARARFPFLRLGLDVSTGFYWGLGLQALVYPIQTRPVSWYLGAGVLGLYKEPMSVQDVARTWDATLGTGLEVRLVPHLSFTFDWRYAFPTPWVTTDGRLLNMGNVMGNALHRSQFMFGLMLHTW